ncbi:MAG: carbohydrate ABC transporter permease [Ruminococcaceae bacterium]|nr:carbohydrate ABC transporter permease [Oscillospiraceae bacterium]
MVKRRQESIRVSHFDKSFDVVNTLFMVIFLLIMFYPLYFTIIVSLSDINEVGKGNVWFYPKGFSFGAYENVVVNDSLWVGYKNSILYTIGYTLYGLFITIPTAYVLSKKDLFAKSFIMWYFLITMYFSGGIVPSYILIKNLQLMNTPWAIILGTMSIYNMIITRTYFSNAIPGELFESAHIDGANEFQGFFKIALPLAKPIIAVIVLYLAVAQWNSYFSAMIYTSDKNIQPLQLVLRRILLMNEQMLTNPDYIHDLSEEEYSIVVQKSRLAESMKYAVIFITSAPLLIAYPFVQKYFVRGVLIGSLKG